MENIQKACNTIKKISANVDFNTNVLPYGLQDSYLQFLEMCNGGGYTEDGFIHIFGFCEEESLDVIKWNDVDLWKKHYGINEKFFCFAEDILGNQFYFDLNTKHKEVKTLWVENGMQSLAANDFKHFLDAFILNLNCRKECHLLYSKYVKNIAPKPKHPSHLSSIIPLSLGGSETDYNNYEYVDPVFHMNIYGQIATQVKNLKPGTRISEVKIDKEKREVQLISEKPKKRWNIFG